jgi:hypothetical protein
MLSIFQEQFTVPQSFFFFFKRGDVSVTGPAPQPIPMLIQSRLALMPYPASLTGFSDKTEFYIRLFTTKMQILLTMSMNVFLIIRVDNIYKKIRVCLKLFPCIASDPLT